MGDDDLKVAASGQASGFLYHPSTSRREKGDGPAI
jgi:hypothetical protein